MKICMVGAGAVGGYFGGRLLECGCDLVFLVREQTCEALRMSGLQIESEAGISKVEPVPAFSHAAQIGPVDLVIAAVKAHELESSMSSVRPLIRESTLILPLQNGVESPEILARFFPRRQILGGFCKILSMRLAPGHIKHAGYRPSIALGPLVESQRPSIPPAAAELSRSPHLYIETPEDIRAAMWEKFLFVAAMGGVGAVCRSSIGPIRSQPETRSLLRSTMSEIADVARHCGVSLPDSAIETAMCIVDSLPPDSTSSMQRDLQQGIPSELEFQTGSVVRLASQAGVPVPVNSTIHAALLLAELAASSTGDKP